MLKKTLLLISVFTLSTISYTEEYSEEEYYTEGYVEEEYSEEEYYTEEEYIIEEKSPSKKPLSSIVLGGWTTYDQNLGALNDDFFTIGGVSMGISVLGIAIGIGVYGSYPYELKNNFIKDDFQMYYGGLVLGYKSVWRTFGFRIFSVLGLGSTQTSNTWDTYRLHFVITPSIHFDWHAYKSFVISAGMSYRYMSNTDNLKYNINHWKNALYGTLSFGWVH